jgi:hypothetical protein
VNEFGKCIKFGDWSKFVDLGTLVEGGNVNKDKVSTQSKCSASSGEALFVSRDCQESFLTEV